MPTQVHQADQSTPVGCELATAVTLGVTVSIVPHLTRA